MDLLLNPPEAGLEEARDAAYGCGGEMLPNFCGNYTCHLGPSRTHC